MAHISAYSVGLHFPIIGAGDRSVKNSILNFATGGKITKGSGTMLVTGLEDVTFELHDGDRLGLIGHNGAGKSTLLKVLAGIYHPTDGKVSVEGRIVSTLNITLGFELEATGYENIFLRGRLLGLKGDEINSKLDEIAEFTELGRYLDLPVRVYSSGMLMRLAFAIMTSLESDILLMDEVIGTGDARFIHKAEKRLNEFMNKAKIMVIASHSDEVIREFCNKALLLRNGTPYAMGGVEEILSVYQSDDYQN
ncbi:ABC transporter ATP-binding protein [Gimesia aquarii]|uniref:Polysialic acid transport ATP-binding protein KpsT n=1 Tax=Gimesia aquarii TaxID=2527964 RepID=A0A517W3V9_9PLAN|nr:ABC transporter ATP-binding protein [Gimesia aquarii]QDT99935.1 Polysialic acid transport ATP-binding protein KpsT [Gimesia aquarii]